MNSGHVTKAVLLAAGKGTRMRELTNELPKPMIPVRGKPILLHIVEGLRAAVGYGDTGFCEACFTGDYPVDVIPPERLTSR